MPSNSSPVEDDDNGQTVAPWVREVVRKYIKLAAALDPEALEKFVRKSAALVSIEDAMQICEPYVFHFIPTFAAFFGLCFLQPPRYTFYLIPTQNQPFCLNKLLMRMKEFDMAINTCRIASIVVSIFEAKNYPDF